MVNSKHYGGNWSRHDLRSVPVYAAENEENDGNLLRFADVLSEI